MPELSTLNVWDIMKNLIIHLFLPISKGFFNRLLKGFTVLLNVWQLVHITRVNNNLETSEHVLTIVPYA